MAFVDCFVVRVSGNFLMDFLSGASVQVLSKKVSREGFSMGARGLLVGAICPGSLRV